MNAASGSGFISLEFEILETQYLEAYAEDFAERCRMLLTRLSHQYPLNQRGNGSNWERKDAQMYSRILLWLSTFHLEMHDDVPEAMVILRSPWFACWSGLGLLHLQHNEVGTVSEFLRQLGAHEEADEVDRKLVTGTAQYKEMERLVRGIEDLDLNNLGLHGLND